MPSDIDQLAALLPDLRKVVDAHNIYAVLARYCQALDRCDLEKMKDVYWQDGTDDHGAFSGNAHEFAEYIIKSIQELFDVTQHTICNVSYDIREDTAVTESYLIAYHRILPNEKTVRTVFGDTYYETHKGSGASSHDYIHGGRYIDRLEKRGDVWRIKARLVTMEWNIMRPSSDIWEEGLMTTLSGAIGRRDREDPVYIESAR